MQSLPQITASLQNILNLAKGRFGTAGQALMEKADQEAEKFIQSLKNQIPDEREKAMIVWSTRKLALAAASTILPDMDQKDLEEDRRDAVAILENIDAVKEKHIQEALFQGIGSIFGTIQSVVLAAITLV